MEFLDKCVLVLFESSILNLGEFCTNKINVDECQ